MRRRDGDIKLRVALRGMVSVSGGRDQSINCIVRESGAMPYHFLAGFLGAIALAATGETQARHFDAIVVGSPKGGVDPARLSRRLRITPAEEARAYIAALAADLLSSGNYYFLPFEAVAEIVEKKGGGRWPGPREITDIIETLRENEFARCRSDYGPIRNPRDYPAPPPDEVIAIIKRRFQPIISIFGRAEGGR
jgi:hypothetical protein